MVNKKSSITLTISQSQAYETGPEKHLLDVHWKLNF